MAYIQDGGERPSSCIFCLKAAEDRDDENLILLRSASCFALLNLFPYNNGHLMIAPYRHVPSISISIRNAYDLMVTAQRCLAALHERAGTLSWQRESTEARRLARGSPHAHFHVVPRGRRYELLPVLADVRSCGTIPQTTLPSEGGVSLSAVRPGGYVPLLWAATCAVSLASSLVSRATPDQAMCGSTRLRRACEVSTSMGGMSTGQKRAGSRCTSIGQVASEAMESSNRRWAAPLKSQHCRRCLAFPVRQPLLRPHDIATGSVSSRRQIADERSMDAVSLDLGDLPR
jgi:ATP adenylyltransferase